MFRPRNAPVKKRHRANSRQSPKGLIESRRKNLALGEHWFEFKEFGPGTFALQATDSLEMVRFLADGLRQISLDVITAAGQDPDQWRQIKHQSTEADQAYIAALLLGRLDAMDRHLAALDSSHGPDAIRFEAHSAVKEALSVAWLFNALAIVEHEVGIIARAKSKAGAVRGGKATVETKAERDRQMATEYKKRRPSSRLSKTALKQEIGAKHGLSRSAAVEAINRGLKKLSG